MMSGVGPDYEESHDRQQQQEAETEDQTSYSVLGFGREAALYPFASGERAGIQTDHRLVEQASADGVARDHGHYHDDHREATRAALFECHRLPPPWFRSDWSAARTI